MTAGEMIYGTVYYHGTYGLITRVKWTTDTEEVVVRSIYGGEEVNGRSGLVAAVCLSSSANGSAEMFPTPGVLVRLIAEEPVHKAFSLF